VLRRSSVRSRTEIFQGTPEKDIGAKEISQSPSKCGHTSERGDDIDSLDGGAGGGEGEVDKPLTIDDMEVIALENSVLRQSLFCLGEQLEVAERKTDLTTKIIERVQQVCMRLHAKR